ncbi:HD domain-containing protein [Paenibacillus sp. LMG 31456]|uniref:HD domain-containing protein n=1 Tax=Paenibacillus foliorum TaxID=2654974 RepID=A0A972GXY9_9BACL|nr:HD-GYP domain-containing protein [Paenibacillus foliorum]NOU96228.1 HD domain-containing protein [Paenibacillus foliorum]
MKTEYEHVNSMRSLGLQESGLDALSAGGLLKNSMHFCPVQLGKRTNVGLWILMGISLATAVWLNSTNYHPALLGIYAVPVIIFSLFVMNVYWVGAFAAAVVALWLYFTEAGWIAMAGAGGMLLMALLMQRVVIVSRRNFQQKAEYEELFMNTILSFSKTIDARDPYTSFHSKNVAGYAQKIATELGLSKREVEAVHLAGLIHDIGKIGTPESILQKESRLTDEEFDIMKRHAEDGYQIIKDIKRLQELGASEMIRHHHERMDGRGYPLGLKGDEIPLGARILAASDAFDAMTTNRSYRQKLSIETAAEELRRHSGTQFDPQVADALLKILVREEIIPAEQRLEPDLQLAALQKTY